MRWICAVLSVAVLLGSQGAAAQTRLTENTIALDEGANPARASLGEMSFLRGAWRGEGLGGTVEEIWSGPAAGAMMGMFRLTDGDTVRFYELMTLAEEGGSLTLRVRHFGEDLVAWEEKEDSQTSRLVHIGEDGVSFEGITFRPDGPDRLLVLVAMRKQDGTHRELRFEYSRMPEFP